MCASLGIGERELFADDPASPGNPRPAPPPPEPAPGFASGAEAIADYEGRMGRRSAWWVYRDAAGSPVGIVARWDRDGSKTIRPAFLVDGAWRHTYPQVRPLYALDRLAQDSTSRVHLVEGEKCAEAIASIGLLATTSPGGSQAAGGADWTALAGREVAILPDADDAGSKYAAAVRERLLALDPPARAAIVTLPDLKDKEDVVEFVGRVHGGDEAAARAAIERLANDALRPSKRRIVTLAELLDDPATLSPPETIASGWWPFDCVQPFKALECGTVSVLAAPPGCFKTATMLRIARGFAEQGHRVDWLAGEMAPPVLARRMMCQRAQVAAERLMRPEALTDEEHDRLDRAGQSLRLAADRLTFTAAPIGFEELRRAAERSRVVFVDYLQLIRHPEPGVRGHERIEDAMAEIAALAQETGAAFILASAQGRDGGGERDIRSATRGSSSIEFTVGSLYCAKEPGSGQRNPLSTPRFVVRYECLKQREGRMGAIEVTIDGRLGLIAEEPAP